MASPVCAIESSRSLRCVVRNVWRVSSSSNCSIAIMLTGPEPVDLLAQVGDDVVRRQRVVADVVDVEPASSAAVGGRRLADLRLRPSSSASGADAAASRRAGRRSSPALPCAATSATTSSSAAPTASTHVAPRGASSRRWRVARATSDCITSARTPSSACRAPRISWSRRAELLAQRDDLLVERRASRLRSGSSARDVVVERLLGLDDRLRAVRRAATSVRCDVGAAAGDAGLEIARRPPRAARTSVSSAPARSVSVACSVRASVTRRSRASAASRAACSRAARRRAGSPRRAAGLVRDRSRPRLRRAAARSRALPRRRGARSVVTTSRRRATRAQFVGAALRLAPSSPTIAFSWSCCSGDAARSRPDRRSRWPRRGAASVAGQRRGFGGHRLRPRRAATASRRGFRGCRARPAAIRPARARRRGRPRRPRRHRHRHGARQVARGRRTSRRSARGRSGARSPPRAARSRGRRSTSARAPGGTTSGALGAARRRAPRRARGSRSGRRLRPVSSASAARRRRRRVRRPRAAADRRAARPRRARTSARRSSGRRRRRGWRTRGAGLAEQEARGVAERGAAGLEFFERSQPGARARRDRARARRERLRQRARDRRAARRARPRRRRGVCASASRARARPSPSALRASS